MAKEKDPMNSVFRFVVVIGTFALCLVWWFEHKALPAREKECTDRGMALHIPQHKGDGYYCIPKVAQRSKEPL